MAWQSLATIALDFDSGIGSARAQAITEALCRRIVALLVLRNGRAEPLASACLYLADARLILVTCRHVFDDGVTLGDLAVPLGDSGALLLLRHCTPRFVGHPDRDVAAIEVREPRARAMLQCHWRVVPLGHGGQPRREGERYVVAGYPYAQMRRVEGRVYARPVVFFARDTRRRGADLRASYARTVLRIDGACVHAPELDGVSGATVWAIDDERGGVDCLLRPAGVQSAFKHDQYVRGELIDAAHELVARLAGASRT